MPVDGSGGGSSIYILHIDRNLFLKNNKLTSIGGQQGDIGLDLVDCDGNFSLQVHTYAVHNIK